MCLCLGNNVKKNKNTKHIFYVYVLKLLFTCGVISCFLFLSDASKALPNLAIHSNANVMCYPSMTVLYCTCLLSLPISYVRLIECSLLTCLTVYEPYSYSIGWVRLYLIFFMRYALSEIAFFLILCEACRKHIDKCLYYQSCFKILFYSCRHRGK